MTSFNNSMPAMLSYYGSQLNNRSSAGSGDTGDQASQDPLADLREALAPMREAEPSRARRRRSPAADASADASSGSPSDPSQPPPETYLGALL